MDDRTAMPLTIRLDREPIHVDGSAAADTNWYWRYIATCLEYPDLLIQDNDPYIAVIDLLEEVQRSSRHIDESDEAARPPLDDETEYSNTWNELVENSHAEWDYTLRDADPETSEEWVATGIPAGIADKFRAMLLEPADAKRLHDAGRTPEETLPYVINAESTGWWNWPDFNVVEWVITRVPVDRVRFYEARCSAAEATAWEGLAALYRLSDQDLDAILRAGFTIAGVATNSARWVDEGHSIGDAARNFLAAAGLDRRVIRIVSSRPR